jgi:hypothetical protein
LGTSSPPSGYRRLAVLFKTRSGEQESGLAEFLEKREVRQTMVAILAASQAMDL